MPDFGFGEALAAGLSFFGGDAAAAGAGLGAAELGADAAVGAGLGEAGVAAGTELGLGAGFASDAAIAGGAGLSAGEAGLAAGTELGLGAGFASDAAIAGGAGLGAGAGAAEAGLAATGLGLGEAAAGLGEAGLAGGTDLGLGAGFASDAAIAGGTGGGALAPGLAATAPAIDVGGAASALGVGAPSVGAAPAAALPAFADPTSLAAAQGGSLFTGAVDTAPAAGEAGSLGAVGSAGQAGAAGAPGLVSDAAGGATVAEGVPLTSTYGPVSAFDTGNALGAGAGTSPGGFGNWLDTQAGKLGDYVSDHPLQAAGTGLSALGLGRSLLTAQNPTPIPGMAQLSQLAGQLGATGTGLINANASSARGVADTAINQGNVLQNYLTTGTLPPAIQAQLDQATKDGITNIRAQYAARGMPPGSSAELQETNALRQRAVIQGGTIAAQLFQQGVSLDQLAGNIYAGLVGTGGSLVGAGAGAQESLINTGVALNTGVNNAIANLSSALGGGSRAIINGQTVTLPQAA